jgi:EmrB/QacA subfamily drug resistance transporter
MDDESPQMNTPMPGFNIWRRLLVEPPQSPRIARSPAACWYVVATVCVGAFMGQLDASIVTLALPTMQQDFGVGMGAVEWVALAYLLVLVALVTVVGRLADMVGRKLLYIYGFGAFVVGSALCGVAPSLGTLVVARVLQGVGAAMLQANSVALIAHAMPKDKLGRGIGVQGAAQALGLALGPMVGGLLIGLGGWRLIFLVNVPAGIVGMLLGWFLLPRTTELDRHGRFDWLGAALLAPTAGGFMGALSFARDSGLASPAVVSLVAVSIMLGSLFLVHERRAVSPMVDLRIFNNARFSAGIASGLLSYLVMFGVLFLVPFYLELRRHMDPAQAGLTLAALPLALGVVAPIAGRVADRVGTRAVTGAGMVIAAGGLVGLGVARDGVALIAELAWIGAGIGAFTPANNAAIMASAPRSQLGVAGGILNMTRGFGTSLGVAATALVYGMAAGGSVDAAGAAVRQGFIVAILFLAVLAVFAAVLAALRGRVPLSPPLATAGAAGVGLVGPFLPPRVSSPFPRRVGRAGAPSAAPAAGAVITVRPRSRDHASSAEQSRRAHDTFRQFGLAALWLAGAGTLLAAIGVAAWSGEQSPHANLRAMLGFGAAHCIVAVGFGFAGCLYLLRDARRRAQRRAGLLAALVALPAVFVGLVFAEVALIR